MKTILVSMLLLAALFVIAPPAAAEPCEVPGCQVVGAAVCVVLESKTIAGNPKQAGPVLAECATATTGPL